MRIAFSLFTTCLVLSLALIWLAGCNLDGGLEDPFRPKADVQVLRFTPVLLGPTRVQTDGSQQVTSSDGLTTSTRPITEILFPRPPVKGRVNNGVSALITGYSITYTFQRPGNPPTGLALYGGPLNVFIDAAPVSSGTGLASGNGPAGQDLIRFPPVPTTTAAFGVGTATFSMEVISPEARDLLVLSPNVVVANITFFVQDINGNNFTVPAMMTLSSTVITEGVAGTVPGL